MARARRAGAARVRVMVSGPRRGRMLAGGAVFGLALLVLWPGIERLPQVPDEAQYGWSAAYFGGRLARLDWRPYGSDGPTTLSDADVDPGWSPASWWARTQPMGSRLLYAAAIGAFALPTPPQPYGYSVPARQSPAQLLPDVTLHVLRVVAAVCAATGLGLFAWRFGAPAVLGLALFLSLPQVREDLVRAWAEGPLLLGLALCAATLGRRWFGVACGLAAAAKLTGVLAWPLLLPGLLHGPQRRERLVGLGLALGTWTLLEPPAWFAGGPLFLGVMVVHRMVEHQLQMDDYGNWGVPWHYLLPLELALSLLLGAGLARLAALIGRLRASARVGLRPAPLAMPGIRRANWPAPRGAGPRENTDGWR